MDKTCSNCGKSLNSKQFKFCSNVCQQELDWRIRKDSFERAGNWPRVVNSYAKARHFKRYLLEIRGHKCELCGIETWQGQEVPLVLDHVDGNSQNDTLDNLRLVCGNCDMQLSTYKGRNRGNGRHSRKLRYTNGQSY